MVHLLQHPENSLQRFKTLFGQYTEFDYFFDRSLIIHQGRCGFQMSGDVILEDNIQSDIIFHLVLGECALVDIENDCPHQIHRHTSKIFSNNKK
jgi:hypothetical protein